MARVVDTDEVDSLDVFANKDVSVLSRSTIAGAGVWISVRQWSLRTCGPDFWAMGFTLLR